MINTLTKTRIIYEIDINMEIREIGGNIFETFGDRGGKFLKRKHQNKWCEECSASHYGRCFIRG